MTIREFKKRFGMTDKDVKSLLKEVLTEERLIAENKTPEYFYEKIREETEQFKEVYDVHISGESSVKAYAEQAVKRIFDGRKSELPILICSEEPVFVVVDFANYLLDVFKEFYPPRTVIELLEFKKQKILASFDFKKVHNVMEALDWKWSTINKLGEEVPTEELLRKEAERIIDTAIRDFSNNFPVNIDIEDCFDENTRADGFVGTGGFEAEVCYDPCDYDESDFSIVLRFIIEDWDA